MESKVSSALLLSTPSDRKGTFITPVQLVSPWKQCGVACPVGSCCHPRALWIAGIWCFRMFWCLETSPVCTERYLCTQTWPSMETNPLQPPDLPIGSVQRALDTGTGMWVLLCTVSPPFFIFYVIRAILETNVELFCLIAPSCALVWAGHPPGPRCFRRVGSSQNLPRELQVLLPGAGRVQYQQWPPGGSAGPRLRAAAAASNSSKSKIAQIPPGRDQNSVPFKNERKAVSFL